MPINAVTTPVKTEVMVDTTTSTTLPRPENKVFAISPIFERQSIEDSVATKSFEIYSDLLNASITLFIALGSTEIICLIHEINCGKTRDITTAIIASKVKIASTKQTGRRDFCNEILTNFNYDGASFKGIVKRDDEWIEWTMKSFPGLSKEDAELFVYSIDRERHQMFSFDT